MSGLTDVKSLPVAFLNPSIGLFNQLTRAGIRTIGDLLNWSKPELNELGRRSDGSAPPAWFSREIDHLEVKLGLFNEVLSTTVFHLYSGTPASRPIPRPSAALFPKR